MKTLLLLFFLLTVASLQAQTTINGRIVDSANKPLSAATVQLNKDTGNIQLQSTLTDTAGAFLFTNVDSGKYVITVSFIGYGSASKIIQAANNTTINLGELQLVRISNSLNTVVVTATTPAVVQKGDTVQYSANQYKVNPDATSEDLVKKMPGITVGSDGTVTAHGETVKKVLVDGKEYFGDDASATLRNLPADVIDKIQVFDKLSDQAQFTGFDDGNTSKAINIVTKGGMRASQFGKVYAGYGTDNRYTMGGNVNFFNGDRRIALIGLSNNINQQNFSQQDLLGVLSTGGNGGRRGGGGGQRGGGGFRGGGAGNFLTGNASGINSTNSLGINYSDTWAKNLTVTGSYFFNNTRNSTGQHTNRQNITPTDTSIFYKEDENSSNSNYNNRINMRMEYKIDSANQLIFTPSIGFQNNQAHSISDAVNTLASGKVLTDVLNSTNSTSSGYNFSANLLYRHAFKKKGRSITLGISPGLSDNTGGTYQDIFTTDTDTLGNNIQDSSQLFRDRNSHVKSIGASIAYTEPVGKKAMVMFNYNPSWQNSTSKQLEFDYNSTVAKYNMLDTSVSNLFNNDIAKQNAGITYRIGDRNNSFMAGLNYQYTDMNSKETYPEALTTHFTFSNLLPNLMFNKRFSPKTSIRLFYRATTQTPSVTQLQNVYNTNNPLFVTIGNPDLKQAYNNTLAARFNFTNTAKSSSLFFNAFIQQNNSYITNAVFTASEDSLLTKTFVLKKSAQLSKPVNLDGYWSYRTFLTYSFPVKAIKTNINLNGGYNYTRQPGLINGIENKSKNSGYSGGVTFASNISEYVDFNIGYNAGYNVVKNSLQPNLNESYYSGSATASINLLSKDGWVFHTDLNNQMYSGLSNGYNQNYTLWNASAGKKFLKNQRGDLRLNVFDILKQNQSITRNVTETYIEDVQTNILQRYFMLTFTYKINNVRTNKAAQNNSGEHDRFVPRAPRGERNGMPPASPGGGI
ncbi:hypothetical protein FC093_14870 [Ilyomonas limi]|uniref:Outer membrane protein beta-barrel domain-containing protein n=1 Tax=Ilyomonas limi TaxID=2575867 RepID=A0A4U3KX41_9BACT|nr:TonB-dependent receptor [Ilyomonas limi]TKK67165.1 hypothetical protein FC093_14870 [Ilyomonas limi]